MDIWYVQDYFVLLVHLVSRYTYQGSMPEANTMWLGTYKQHTACAYLDVLHKDWAEIVNIQREIMAV